MSKKKVFKAKMTVCLHPSVNKMVSFVCPDFCFCKEQKKTWCIQYTFFCILEVREMHSSDGTMQMCHYYVVIFRLIWQNVSGKYEYYADRIEPLP